MPKTEQDKVLDKIKKCLRLAASSNANEAATAMRQAQALMAQHNITLTDVQAAEASSYIASANVKKKPTTWETILARISANAFSCELIFTSDNWSSRGGWSFVGVGSSPELAGYAFSVLLRQVKRDRAAYIKTDLKRCKQATKTVRADSFCLSWVMAASHKITAIAPSAKASTAIAAYMDKHYTDSTSLKSRVGGGGMAKKYASTDSLAGRLSGLDATLNRGVNGQASATGICNG